MKISWHCPFHETVCMYRMGNLLWPEANNNYFQYPILPLPPPSPPIGKVKSYFRRGEDTQDRRTIASRLRTVRKKKNWIRMWIYQSKYCLAYQIYLCVSLFHYNSMSRERTNYSYTVGIKIFSQIETLTYR